MSKMKKILLALLLALALLPLIPTKASAQAAVQMQMGVTTSSTVSTLGIAVPTTYFHQVTWTTAGAPATCTITADSSTDNAAFSAGGVIASQNCAGGSGQSQLTNVITSYVRLTVTITGPGSVRVNYTGYSSFDVASPGAIGGTTPAAGTFTTITGTALALNGSAPALTTPGTTPYFNLNTLTKGTKNTCTFALTTSTLTLALSPVSLCTFTLPNAALVWYWQCTLGWSNPAGTTPTIAEGVTWAQAPSVATQIANILTTNTGTSTQAETATTTNAVILTSPTLTNSATVFQATMSGSFTASATSGVFSPTLTLTGTGATGTAVGGCTIQ